MLKKSISVLLALVMLFSVVVVIPTSAYAEETADDGATDTGLVNNDLTVTGTNSLGSMLAAEYEENADESEASGSGVYAVEVVGKTARADIRTLVDAQLIISIFDEDGNIMYGSGMTDVTPDDSIVELTLEVDTMPQYFFIRAYLLDKVTNLPLCKQFENDYYTQQMQEFFAKTTDDFDEEKVLNLDEDDTDNFLVYNDDTTVIQNDSSEVNVITYADDDEKKYIIENIDESISQLQPGEIFSCENDDYHIIVKIKTIEINNGIATITGEDIELNDAFDYIKIDAAQNSDDAVVDNSNLEEGVEYLGSFVDDDDLAPTGAEIIDEDITASTELSYKITEKEFAGGLGKFTGTIGLKLDINLRCYYDAHLFKKDEIEFSFNLKYKIGLKAKIEMKSSITINIPLGYCGFSPVPGVYIDFTPSFVVEGKVSVEFEGSLVNGQIGKSFKNGVWSDENKSPKFTFEAKVEAEVFFGLSLKPHIGILGDVVSATAEAKAGVRVHGELPLVSPDSGSYPDERHNCSKCIKGDISFYCELSVKLSLVNNDRFTWDNKIKRSNKISDFYYSFDTGKFAFTTCPNKSFKQTVTVLSKKKAPYAGVDVNGVKTSKNGVAVVYINGGKQTLTFEKDGKTVSKTKTIREAGKLEFTIDFDNPNSSGSVVGHKDGKITDTGQCGDDAYYTLTDKGLLTITGTGEIYSYESPFYDYKDKVKEAIIMDGITRIGEEAFFNLYRMTCVTIPETVTDIGKLAFWNCPALNEFIVDERNDYFCSIDGNLYTKDNTVLLKYAPGKEEKSFVVPDGVMIIAENAFSDSVLTSIVLPYGITELEDNAFSEARHLISIIMPDSIREIGEAAFHYCEALTSITIPNGITRIGNSTFSGCSSLNNVIIPDSVTYIGSYAFSWCYSLTSLTIPAGVRSIGGSPCPGCKSMTDLTVVESNPNYCSEEGALYNKDKTRLIQYAAGRPNSVFVIPDTVSVIGNQSFERCASLTAIVMGRSVKTIESGAFSYCDALKDVYYKGSEAEFEEIMNIDSFREATIHYNSTGEEIALTATGEGHITDEAAATGADIVTADISADENEERNATFSRSHLIPDTEAVLVILQGNENTVEFNSESLLFIAQDTVDENGSVSFDVNNDLGDTWVAYIFAECDHSSSSWQTAKQPAEGEEGLNILVCEHCGEVIGSEIIEALPVKYLLGDADGNGRIEVTDATSVQRFIASVETPYTKEELLRGDVDASGELEIIDVTAIQSYLAEISIPYLIGSDVV